MEANDLVVLAPISGACKLMNLEWGAGPEPYGLRHMITRGGKRFATFNYTYPGGPEVHAYLVVPKDSLSGEDFKPAGKYWGARNAGPLTAVPTATLVRSRKSRLVIPGATAEEAAAVLKELQDAAKPKPKSTAAKAKPAERQERRRSGK